jgi:hypothetical protein
MAAKAKQWALPDPEGQSARACQLHLIETTT